MKPLVRIPLTIVVEGTGHKTDGVLVAVMTADLDALEAVANDAEREALVNKIISMFEMLQDETLEGEDPPSNLALADHAVVPFMLLLEAARAETDSAIRQASAALESCRRLTRERDEARAVAETYDVVAMQAEVIRLTWELAALRAGLEKLANRPSGYIVYPHEIRALLGPTASGGAK